MDNLEKLISNLSNYWDLSPEKVVDRLNHMNESEIKNVVNKMTKKFQGGGYLSNGMPIGNRMIISKTTTYKRPVTDEMIDSAIRAENQARMEQFKREAAELKSRNYQTQMELMERRGAAPAMKTQPSAPEAGSVGPAYYNGPRPKFENGGGIMKCLKGGNPYSECMKCGGKTKVVKNQPGGEMKIEPEVEPKGFFKRMFWKPTEYPRVDSYDKFDGDFNGTRSSYYTHDGDLMQILTKKFPAGNTAKTELLIENPHTPLADSTMTITNSNGTDKIRNMRKAKQFLPAFKKNF